MTTPFFYSTTYMLDKSHFSETFDESNTQDNSKKAYLKGVFLAVFGLAVLLFTEIHAYIAWFIIALGGLEVFSIRFRKSWWLARQLISKAANTELTLNINPQGVYTRSFSVESEIPWTSVNKIEHTNQGWLLYHAGGKNYLSSRCLSEEAIAFIKTKALLTTQ
jgi:hypothetical protein